MIVTQLKTLRERSINLIAFDKKLETDLIEELDKHPSGVGISAVQIGVLSRMCIISDMDYVTKEINDITLWNPVIISLAGDVITNYEQCLSLPGESVRVVRAEKIVVKNGDGKEYKFSDFTARIVQHEIDHMDGILITDYKSEDLGI